MELKKALFLDRDGVINEDAGYVSKVEDFRFCDGIFEALREFMALGYTLVIITNQSGIGRGYYTQADYETLTNFMLDKFSENGVKIARVYHCPHVPEEGCECRKPAPAMLIKAHKELGIDMTKSIMIGDKQSDIEAANSAGVARAYLLDGVGLKSVKDVLNEIKKEIK